MTPRVSVLMSVRNGAGHVEGAVESVLAQTFEDFELVVIDDGSTDDTFERLSGFADRRVRIVRNDVNLGLTRSLTLGLGLIQAELVARQDADDRSYAQRLERQVALLDERPEIAWCGTWARIVDGEGRILVRAHVATEPEEIVRLLPEHNQFVHGSVLFRRDAVASAGGYRDVFRFAQDYDLSLRLAEREGLANVPEELYELTSHRDRLSLERLEEQQWYAELARRLAAERRLGPDALQRGRPIDDLLAETRAALGRGRYFSFLADSLWLLGDKRGYRRAMLGLARAYPHSPRLWFRLLLSLVGRRQD